MVKVVHLTSVHKPTDTRIFLKECQSLSSAGYEVTLIAPYTQVIQKTGICHISSKKSRNRIERILLTTWRVFFLAIFERGKIYHFHDPELLPFGILLKLMGKTVVYDVHEDLPSQVLNKDWIPNYARGIVSFLCKVIGWIGAKFFDSIIAATPKIASRFPAEKVTTIQNFPISSELVSPVISPYTKRPNNLAYIGAISSIRGIHQMVQSLDLIPADNHVRLVLAGFFSPESLEDDIRKLPGWRYVDYLGVIDRQQVANVLGAVKIGLVLFHPKPNHLEAQPNKFFEYMSAGIPIIASDFPLWRQIIDKIGCGLLTNPLDPKSIAETIRWLLDHPEDAVAMGQRGQKAIQTEYNWQNEEKKLLALYKRML